MKKTADSRQLGLPRLSPVPTRANQSTGVRKAAATLTIREEGRNLPGCVAGELQVSVRCSPAVPAMTAPVPVDLPPPHSSAPPDSSLSCINSLTLDLPLAFDRGPGVGF